jgi:hypothetical protein
VVDCLARRERGRPRVPAIVDEAERRRQTVFVQALSAPGRAGAAVEWHVQAITAASDGHADEATTASQTPRLRLLRAPSIRSTGRTPDAAASAMAVPGSRQLLRIAFALKYQASRRLPDAADQQAS